MTQAIAFLDVEATGLRRESYPIEVGVAVVRGRDLEAVASWLVKPHPDWDRKGLAWEPEAVSLTGLTPEHVRRFGAPGPKVCGELETVLDGIDEVYCDAVAYDGRWMWMLYAKAERPMPFKLRDIQELPRLAAKMNADRARALWESKVRKVNAEISLTRHRAGPDAERLARAYLKLEPRH